MSFFTKFFTKEKKEDLNKGLEKTKSNFFDKIARAVAGKDKVDDEVLDNLEEILISSDVGLETTVNVAGDLNVLINVSAIVTFVKAVLPVFLTTKQYLTS